MVNPLETRLIKPARLAHPGMLFQGHGLWLYPGNEKKHACSNPDIPGTEKVSRKGAKPQENLQPIGNQTWSQPSENVIRRINNDLGNFILNHSFLSLRLRTFA